MAGQDLLMQLSNEENLAKRTQAARALAEYAKSSSCSYEMRLQIVDAIVRHLWIEKSDGIRYIIIDALGELGAAPTCGKECFTTIRQAMGELLVREKEQKCLSAAKRYKQQLDGRK